MLKTDYILEELKSGNKRDVLKELVGSFMKIHQKLDSEATLNVLFERENWEVPVSVRNCHTSWKDHRVGSAHLIFWTKRGGD